MTLKDHFYWKSQQQFKMDYIFWEEWIIANFSLPSTSPCDSSCPNLKSTICLFLRQSASIHLWSKEKYMYFQSTVYLTYFRCSLLIEMNQTPASINHPDCQSSVACNRNTRELLWCWYSPIRWSQIRNWSLEKDLCEPPVICRAGPKEW